MFIETFNTVLVGTAVSFSIQREFYRRLFQMSIYIYMYERERKREEAYVSKNENMNSQSKFSCVYFDWPTWEQTIRRNVSNPNSTWFLYFRFILQWCHSYAIVDDNSIPKRQCLCIYVCVFIMVLSNWSSLLLGKIIFIYTVCINCLSFYG